MRLKHQVFFKFYHFFSFCQMANVILFYYRNFTSVKIKKNENSINYRRQQKHWS